MLEVDWKNKWFRPAETPPEKSPPGPHGDVDEGNAHFESQFFPSRIWTCLRPEGSPLLPPVSLKYNFIGSHHLLPGGVDS